MINNKLLPVVVVRVWIANIHNCVHAGYTEQTGDMIILGWLHCFR